MQLLGKIAKVEDITKRNKDLVSIIAVLQDVTHKILRFKCKS